MYTEEELLKMWRDNPDKGTVLLMEQYEKLIWNVCARRLENPEDIKECVNETFADFFVNHEKFEGEKSNLKNYLCMIADRKAIDTYRKNQRREHFLNEEAEKIKEKQDFAEITSQEIERLESAMEQLPPTDRKILEMKYYDEMSYEEIGKKLDMSVDSVRKRGQRGKKRLLYLLLIGLVIATLIACSVAIYKKYYYSDAYGYIWTDDPIYELVNKGAYFDTELIRYTVENGLYQNGHLELMLDMEYLGEDEVITAENIKRIETEISELLGTEIYLDNPHYIEHDVKSTKGGQYMDFFVALGRASHGLYLCNSNGGYYNVDASYAKGHYEELDDRKAVCSLYATSENAFLMTKGPYSDSLKFWLCYLEEGKVELEFSALPQKEYVESEQNVTLLNEDILTLGPAMAGTPFTVIDLFKEKNEELEYQLTSFLLHSQYGLGKREIGRATLTNGQGVVYNSMRITDQNMDERQVFELYFPSVPAGDYTLTLPYICFSKEEDSQVITLDLPTGEETYKTCDENVLFADGNGIHITGIERTESIESLVNVNGDGSLHSVVELKQWKYLLDWEPILSEGELEFCTALVRTTDAAYNTGIGINDRPAIKIDQDANVESVEIYFTNPIYVWEHELDWNVTIQESE